MAKAKSKTKAKRPTTRKRTEKALDLEPKKIVLLERQTKALALRRMGASWVQIARRMKELAGKTPEEGGVMGVPPRYDASHARKDVLAACQYWAIPGEEEAQIERLLWLERYDELFAALYPLAKRGDLFSIDRIFGIADRRAKLIPGVYAKPDPVEVKGTLGVAGVNDQGEVEGPVVVKIEWPDVPNDNTMGAAEPGDPATDIEVTKALIGMLGKRVGERVALVVRETLAMIAEEDRQTASLLTEDTLDDPNDETAREIAAMLGGS